MEATKSTPFAGPLRLTYQSLYTKIIWTSPPQKSSAMVSGTGISNCTQQYLRGAITCTCLWYLLLAHKPSIMVSRKGISNCTLHYLRGAITCTCLWYLLLAHTPSIVVSRTEISNYNTTVSAGCNFLLPFLVCFWHTSSQLSSYKRPYANIV